jgi:hypothetical protein
MTPPEVNALLSDPVAFLIEMKQFPEQESKDIHPPDLHAELLTNEELETKNSRMSVATKPPPFLIAKLFWNKTELKFTVLEDIHCIAPPTTPVFCTNTTFDKNHLETRRITK